MQKFSSLKLTQCVHGIEWIGWNLNLYIALNKCSFVTHKLMNQLKLLYISIGIVMAF